MVTTIQILVMSDELPGVVGKDYPQVIMSSDPDLTPEQWAALGWRLACKFAGSLEDGEGVTVVKAGSDGNGEADVS